MTRLLLLLAVILSGVSLALAGLTPLHSLLTRLWLLVSAASFLLVFGVLCWSSRSLRIIFLFLLALLALPFLLPGRPVDPDRLRDRYVEALERYDGVPYLWGGEGSLGIDCSGLPRRAFRSALFREALSSGNGALFRETLRQWWFDASARALAAGHRGVMIPLHQQGAIRETSFSGLLPGDLAVTASGTHCLVYLRDGIWIQADPGEQRVILCNASASPNAWLDTPVTLHRWQLLSDTQQTQ